jgi:hypothetical protein
MKNIIMGALLGASLIFSVSGCKIVRSIGETLGVVEEKQEPHPTTTKPNNEKSNVSIPNNSDDSGYLGWLVILSVVAVALFGVKFFLDDKKEKLNNKPKPKKRGAK